MAAKTSQHARGHSSHKLKGVAELEGKHARCTRCRAPIVWFEFEPGRFMPPIDEASILTVTQLVTKHGLTYIAGTQGVEPWVGRKHNCDVSRAEEWERQEAERAQEAAVTYEPGQRLSHRPDLYARLMRDLELVAMQRDRAEREARYQEDKDTYFVNPAAMRFECPKCGVGPGEWCARVVKPTAYAIAKGYIPRNAPLKNLHPERRELGYNFAITQFGFEADDGSLKFSTEAGARVKEQLLCLLPEIMGEKNGD